MAISYSVKCYVACSVFAKTLTMKLLTNGIGIMLFLFACRMEEDENVMICGCLRSSMTLVMKTAAAAARLSSARLMLVSLLDCI